MTREAIRRDLQSLRTRHCEDLELLGFVLRHHRKRRRHVEMHGAGYQVLHHLLKLVPDDLREACYALGVPRWRTIMSVVLPTASAGLTTGVMLAVARVTGETAPLLFTSFNNRFFTTKLTQPIATLTVQVFTYATGPYDDWHRQAWAGALVLVMIVLVCSLLARFATRRLERMHARG